MGNTHIVELLDAARKARKKAAQDLEAAAAGSSAVEGTAALDKAAAGASCPGEGKRAAAAERQDPKKSCWMCHSSEHAVQLRVCSGCRKVRLFTAFSSFSSSSQHNRAMCRVYLEFCFPLTAA